jgi:hypothetical protein
MISFKFGVFRSFFARTISIRLNNAGRCPDSQTGMSQYLFVEWRDRFESRSFSMRCELAAGLAREGAAVTVFLVENAVLGTRDFAPAAELAMLTESGATVMPMHWRYHAMSSASTRFRQYERICKW